MSQHRGAPYSTTIAGAVTFAKPAPVDIPFDEHLPPIYSVLRAGEEGRIIIEVLAQSDGVTTLRALVREYLFISLFRACAESLASEKASRWAAMERANRNIAELLENLQGYFHRLRQSGIDEELFDVISGFEALSGPRLHAET
jgi:F-type H+-transporting ATPase subunit gamma